MSDPTEEELDEVIKDIDKQKDSQPEEVLTDPTSMDQFAEDMGSLYWN